MSVYRKTYWDQRLERWGAWRVGYSGFKVATWQGLRAGASLASWALGDEAVPHLHEEERETHELLAHLPRDDRVFAVAAYPAQRGLARRVNLHPDALHARYRRLHRLLARLLDQRRRGEPLDIVRPRPLARRVRPKIGRTQVASVALD